MVFSRCCSRGDSKANLWWTQFHLFLILLPSTLLYTALVPFSSLVVFSTFHHILVLYLSVCFSPYKRIQNQGFKIILMHNNESTQLIIGRPFTSLFHIPQLWFSARLSPGRRDGWGADVEMKAPDKQFNFFFNPQWSHLLCRTITLPWNTTLLMGVNGNGQNTALFRGPVMCTSKCEWAYWKCANQMQIFDTNVNVWSCKLWAHAVKGTSAQCVHWAVFFPPDRASSGIFSNLKTVIPFNIYSS